MTYCAKASSAEDSHENSPLTTTIIRQSMALLLSSGSNSHGQLGIGSRDDAHTLTTTVFPADFEAPHQVTAMAFGGTHTLALLTSNMEEKDLFVAGSNARGQLGRAPSEECYEGFTNLPLEVLLSALPAADQAVLGGKRYRIHGIAALWETSFVHLKTERGSDVLLAMGANDWDELGLGGALPTSFVSVIPLWQAFDKKAALKTSPSITIHSIAAGPRHVLVIASISPHHETKLLGWGAARHGQLGSIFPLPDANYRPPRTIQSPTILSLPTTSATPPQELLSAVGRDHSALTHGQEIILLGSSKQGQLGPNPDIFHGTLTLAADAPASVIEALACTWTGTYIISRRGDGQNRVLALGANSHGQLARPLHVPSSATPIEIPLPPSRARSIRKVACGSEHVLVLADEDGKRCLYGWGWNEHGNLATGGTEDVLTPRSLWLAAGVVEDVWGGNATSWALIAE